MVINIPVGYTTDLVELLRRLWPYTTSMTVVLNIDEDGKVEWIVAIDGFKV